MIGQNGRVNAFEYLNVIRDEKIVSIYDIRENYRNSLQHLSND